MLFEMMPQFANHIIRLLVGDQAASQFYMCFARQHGLPTWPLITSEEAIDLDRRAIPLTFQHTVAWFTKSGGGAHVGQVLLLIERQLIERFS